MRLQLQDLVLDLFHQTRASMVHYGVQIAAELCNQTNAQDQLYMHLLKAMTHHRQRDVRRTCVQQLRAPFSQMTLVMLGKRLRDKDDEIRRQTYMKLARCKVGIESFPSREQRMLIIKEGLTDQSQGVREACMEFLRPSMTTVEGADENGAEKRELISDLSYLFKLIDCKLLFIKEYYIQIPFIIMRFVFALAGDSDLVVARYLESLLAKLRATAGLDDAPMPEDIAFEEMLFLRIAFEFSKLYRGDRS